MRCKSIVIPCLLVFIIAGCGPGATPQGPVPQESLILATTTSTADTGLLDVINEAFERKHPEFRVKTIAVGTGEALKMGENKDADVVLVHSRPAEEEFVRAGYGQNRRDVMYNDYVVVGPPSDPAGISGLGPVEALVAIAATAQTFLSRSDNSGTHKKEQALWSETGQQPAGAWYLETGQGMGATLQIADEKQGYTLTDRGTFLAMSGLGLVILVEKDPELINQYGVIEVVGARSSAGARAYADFITSSEGQKIIETFGLEKFGQPLFFPNAR